ncbi:Chlorophyll A-B binding protein [Cynara cardunculus var. scolymus]|uniref:Chlorophyll A-B binding protein n=1 Tax=Cynara cardunculus var. scolymus TaxID=59895 RepID=A0A118JUL6_CYNCS|nr:Chlorophyll A-B binding protein [Cynara cardunculus var. scolymus]
MAATSVFMATPFTRLSATQLPSFNKNSAFSISNGGVAVFVVTSVVLSVASLVPLLKGVSVQSKSKGIMTSDAELWNGRFAMLGLVGLAFTEFTPLNIEANDGQWRRIEGGYIRCRHKMLCLYLWWRNDEVSSKNRYRIHEL